MPWIDHCSLSNIVNGEHSKPENCVLIQIVDPDMEFPEPKYRELFESVFQFKFLDLDDDSDFCISNTQAETIASILMEAKALGHNVLIHCVMGVCRSGGVAQAGEALGFKYNIKPCACPNLLVKHKIMKSFWSEEYAY